MTKSPLIIAVTDKGKRIGTLTPEQFRQGFQGSNRKFLSQQVEDFNTWKAQIGEPERVAIVLS